MSGNLPVPEAPGLPATSSGRPSGTNPIAGVIASRIASLIGSTAIGPVTAKGQGCRLSASGTKVEGREGAPERRHQANAKAAPNRRIGKEVQAEAAAGVAIKHAADEEPSGAQARQRKVQQELPWLEAASIAPHREGHADQQAQHE